MRKKTYFERRWYANWYRERRRSYWYYAIAISLTVLAMIAGILIDHQLRHRPKINESPHYDYVVLGNKMLRLSSDGGAEMGELWEF